MAYLSDGISGCTFSDFHSGKGSERSCLIFPDMNVVVCIKFFLGEFSRRSTQGGSV